MEDALAIFALIGIVLLVCAIFVLGGAFVWPKLTEAIVENFARLSSQILLKASCL